MKNEDDSALPRPIESPLPWGAPCIVMVAPNGARRTQADHPALPLTPAEMARTASACLEAGAAAIHVHVRDAELQHSIDAGAYVEMIDAIRGAVGEGLFLQITTEAVGRFTPAEQMATVRAVRPESASVAVRELIPPDADDAHLSVVESFIDWCGTENIALQYIVYDAVDLERFNTLRARGVIPDESAFLQLVLGKYATNRFCAPPELLPYLGVLREGDIWSVCAFGPLEGPALLGAAMLGGHGRIGFENNIYHLNGEPAASNAEQVAGLVSGIRSLGRDLARADDIRELLANR